MGHAPLTEPLTLRGEPPHLVYFSGELALPYPLNCHRCSNQIGSSRDLGVVYWNYKLNSEDQMGWGVTCRECQLHFFEVLHHESAITRSPAQPRVR